MSDRWFGWAFIQNLFESNAVFSVEKKQQQLSANKCNNAIFNKTRFSIKVVHGSQKQNATQSPKNQSLVSATIIIEFVIISKHAFFFLLFFLIKVQNGKQASHYIFSRLIFFFRNEFNEIYDFPH